MGNVSILLPNTLKFVYIKLNMLEKLLKGKSSKIDNPYHTYDRETGGWFFDDETFNKLRKRLNASKSGSKIILQGNPCSGKTRILKRIPDHPEFAPPNFIPIYLNTRKYIQISKIDVLLNFSRDIIEGINKHGYNRINERDISLKKIKLNNQDLCVKSIDSSSKSDPPLVILLDEFDHLLENINEEIASYLIEYWRYLKKERNFFLVLAKDKKKSRFWESQEIPDFLMDADIIEVQDDFEEEKIREWITEPVRDQIKYDEEAIKAIIRNSGRKLYFQQLICFYIFNLLRQNKRNVCSKEDVDKAVECILEDPPPDFTNVWDNKLSINGRLITAALADKDVTKLKTDSFYIEEGNLIDDIFGGDLLKEIEKLNSSGYIKQLESRNFRPYPFSLPIYGGWIEKTHPFVETIIEHIDGIADKIKIERLIGNIQETSGNRLKFFKTENFRQMYQAWCSLKNNFINEKNAENVKNMRKFFHCIAMQLGLKLKEIRSSTHDSYIFEIKDLNIGIFEEAYCFIQDKPELKDQGISFIERRATVQANEAPNKITIFFYFRKTDKVEEISQKTYLNLVSIDENDLKKIIFSERPKEIFRQIILSKSSLQKISPYQTTGVAIANFYGRSDIINQINGSPQKSFAIVGGRRIGKSSLLHKIKKNCPPNTLYIFMDLEVAFSQVENYEENYDTFLNSLEYEIEHLANTKVDFKGDISKIPGVIHHLSQKLEKNIVFILDEIDELILFDEKHNFQLMKIFRSTSQNGYCQYIFAGFKKLYQQKRNIENPLYNFYEEIPLSTLDREAALALVTEPMKSIGVNYHNEDDRELILKHTSSHPNLLQFICKYLIQKIEKHENIEERRTISRKDIEDIVDSDYEKYIVDEIYMFFSDLTNIDRLIVILLAEDFVPDSTFSEGFIKKKLKRSGIKISITKVHEKMCELVMRFILLEEGINRYCFTLPIFPSILKKRIDEDFKIVLIEDIKSREDNIEA